MKNLKRVALCLGTAAVMASCAANKGNALSSGLNPDNFVDTVNGKPTALYTLRNANGMEVSITNFGGRIVSVMVPNSNDSLIDVVLGFDNVKTYADYKHTPSDFGAAIGRYANRIAQGKINVDGQEIQLPKNNFGHCLHGGPTGWQYQVYDVVETNDSTIKLAIDSPDGDNNFPGNVKASVTYTLTSNNAIDIKYEATTDKKTVINMTNHTYFNLS
ncbi:MAG: galactose-1-epimerase, partial [Bacteroidaceae bacterium]|nr:galactose-1-epimerase [Bacteroidaceae bacterium]